MYAAFETAVTTSDRAQAQRTASEIGCEEHAHTKNIGMVTERVVEIWFFYIYRVSHSLPNPAFL